MSNGRGKGVGKRSNHQNGHHDSIKKSKFENGHSSADSFSLNPILEAVKSQMKTKWTSEKPKSNGESDPQVELSHEPFTYCAIKNFVQSPKSLLEDLTQELNDLQMTEKNNDLYKFHQSGDLKAEKQEMIQKFIHFLQTRVKEFLKEVTQIEFSQEIDLFCAKYNYTDYLLCHDDELEGRRIAFIWYLVPPSWKEKDGGALDLFQTQANGDPGEVVKSLTPTHNSFVFFEVTPKSFHQVNEVLTQDKTRLSVGGWFHGSTQPRPTKTSMAIVSNSVPKPPTETEEELFFSWINLEYVDDTMQMQIRVEFEENSEISLQNFFDPEKIAQLSDILGRDGIPWEWLGPANKRNHERLKLEGDLDPLIHEFLQIMTSDAMFLLLSNLTGIRLHTLADITPDDNDHDDDDDGDDDDAEDGDGDEEDAAENNDEDADKADNPNDDDDDDDNHDDDDQNKPVPTANGTTEKKDQVKASGSKDTTPQEDAQSAMDEAKSEPVNAKSVAEIRQWRQGSYTLVHDEDIEKADLVLDAKVFFNCKDWGLECGGYSSYIEKDEDRELLSVQPSENTLMLVCRDNKTLRFVKRVTDDVNHKLKDGRFQELSMVYYEK
ncbi:prolyl 3-hydroxylase OGFOD1-like [Tigriopus californicus]|uniref:prolyl 3-hydroxylase OGFOD1-like n=1 Tax=Tigriopus californicus TaxID=6832 RepID=UPI0027DA4D8D|nr:prolyl 3-hydroxylase OGFOD1-like [Tigriopus californicus]